MPLQTIVHGELWEKNVLLHRRSHFEMGQPGGAGGSNGGSQRSQRKVFDAKTSLQMSNGSPAGSSPVDFEELRNEEDREFLESRFDLLTSRDLPYDVMLSDWKCATLGSPTFDLAALLLSATPSRAFRDQHTRPLLQTYHRVFTSTLKNRFGLEYPDFTCDALIKDYELSLYGGFLKVRYKYKVLPPKAILKSSVIICYLPRCSPI